MNKQARTKKLTLIDHIEAIVELAEKSKLTPEFYKQAQKHTRYVGQKLDLTPEGSVLIALFLNESAQQKIELKHLAQFVDCPSVKLLRLMGEMDILTHKKYIRSLRNAQLHQFLVPIEFVNAVRKEDPFEPTNYLNLDKDLLFVQIKKILVIYERGEMSFETMIEDFNYIIQNNQHLNFCKEIAGYMLAPTNLITLIVFCSLLVNDLDNLIDFHDFLGFFGKRSEVTYTRNTMRSGEHCLMCEPFNLIDFSREETFVGQDCFCLTQKAHEELLSDYTIKDKPNKLPDNLLKHISLQSKELYYNHREGAQIEKLTELLVNENFRAVQERLEQNGMRRGFACLFYGAPGTGKTETVYQIARRTGRDLMVVDVSQIKNKWVGDSEKNIKFLFDRYRKHCAQSPVAPILLFNEADAVIGIRKEGGSDAVDKMENSIQNIILQEMETLEGVMIATTNLTQNLDKAFERRFLYKIEFDQPQIEAKRSIWRSMIPALGEDQVAELAENYQFSGGQIENIVRKRTVDAILLGHDASLEEMHDYCKAEFLVKQTSRRKIGY